MAPRYGPKVPSIPPKSHGADALTAALTHQVYLWSMDSQWTKHMENFDTIHCISQTKWVRLKYTYIARKLRYEKDLRHFTNQTATIIRKKGQLMTAAPSYCKKCLKKSGPTTICHGKFLRQERNESSAQLHHKSRHEGSPAFSWDMLEWSPLLWGWTIKKPLKNTNFGSCRKSLETPVKTQTSQWKQFLSNLASGCSKHQWFGFWIHNQSGSGFQCNVSNKFVISSCMLLRKMHTWDSRQEIRIYWWRWYILNIT